MRERGRDRAALASLAALVALLFHRALFQGEAFYERDIQFDAYTSFDSFVQSVSRGSLPLWDNAIAFGQPLLAYPNSQVLYPLTWLNLLLRPSVQYTVFVVAHALLAAIGAYGLGRALGQSRAAAVLTASLWTCSGPFLSLANVYHFAGASWIPWVWWAAEVAFAAPSVRSGALLGAAGAAQVLAGSPEMCAAAQALVLCSLAVHLLRREVAGRRLLAAAAGGTLVAAGLAAAQWVPTLAIVLGSPREALPEAARLSWSVKPWALVQLLLPVPFDALELRQPARFGEDPFVRSLYLGLPALPLVLLGWRRGSPRRAVLVLLLLGSVAVALGAHTPAYGLLMRLAPPLRMFRYPSKVMVVAAAGWAVLGGLGLDAWSRAEPGARRRPGALLPAGVVLGLAAAVLAGSDRLAAELLVAVPEDWPALVSRLWWSVLCGALCWAILWARGGPRRLAAVALVAADLLVAHAALNRTAPRVLLDFKPPWVEALRPPDRGRVFAYEYLYLPPDVVRDLLHHDERYVLRRPAGVPLERAQLLSQRLYPFPPSAARYLLEGSWDVDERGLYPPFLDAATRRAYRLGGGPAFVRLLQAGGVQRVASLHDRGLESLPLITVVPTLFPEPLRIRAVPGSVPRAYAVGAARAADDARGLLLLADGAVDPHREVILQGGGEGDPRAPFAGSVRVLRLDPDRVDLEAELDRDGFVVMVDTWDPGWRTRVDGRPAELLRANGAFRAVRVPAGRHRVEMTYRPRSVTLGALLSLATLAALVPALRHRQAPGDSTTRRASS